MGNNVLCGVNEFTGAFFGLDEGASSDFFVKYEIGPKLGEGGYAVVYQCTRNSDEKSFAVKAGKRAFMKDKDVNSLKYEFSMLKTLCHPNIISAVDLFEERHHLYAVMELVEGGELFQRLVRRKRYSEADARTAAVAILRGIEYMHSKNILHCDLKPENILLASRGNDFDIKIADFGLARVVCDEILTSRCGTPNFVSPELINGRPYGKPTDMWAFGVILYMLLGGCMPFRGNELKRLFHNIRNAKYRFHKERWAAVSSEAKHLVRSLLVVSTTRRLTATQALRWRTRGCAAMKQHSQRVICALRRTR